MFIYNSIESSHSLKVGTLKGFTILLEKATNSENNLRAFNFWNIKMYFNPLTWGRGRSCRDVMEKMFIIPNQR